MIDLFEKNRVGILLMLTASLCVCLGQLCWKLSTNTGYLMLVIGFVLYGIGALIMLHAYKFGSLSVLQPMLSINYVLSTVLALTVLNEIITLSKIIGIIIITTGVLLIGGDAST